MKKVLFLLLLSFLAGTTAFAADGGPYLADRHVARGMKCADCHTPDNKLKTSGDLDVCASCHGDYQAMIKKTDGRYEVIPMASMREHFLALNAIKAISRA